MCKRQEWKILCSDCGTFVQDQRAFKKCREARGKADGNCSTGIVLENKPDERVAVCGPCARKYVEQQEEGGGSYAW